MTEEFNFETNRASNEWLSSVLSKSGYLTDGEVVHVDQREASLGQGSAATFYHLDLRYSDNGRGDQPESMLLKVAKPGATEGFEATLKAYAAYQLVAQANRYDLIQKEPVFYEAVRGEGFPLPLIKCYGVSIDHVGRQNCLLLQDLSENWGEPVFPLPPSDVACANTVRALAQIHAHCWDSDRFGTTGFPPVTDSLIDEVVSIYRATFELFASNISDRLSPRRRKVYAQALEALPGLLRNRFQESEVTLIHGDAHHWNVLVHNETDDTLVYDWQTWHVDCGAHDLAYLMALSWFPERR